MSAVATLTVARLKENITEARSTMTAATQPSVKRFKSNLTETKRQILSNISDALKDDIELKRREQAKLKAQKLANAKREVAAETTSTSSAWATTSPVRPAFEPGRQPEYCDYRSPRRGSRFSYHSYSHGRPCTCDTPHLRLSPQQWRCSAAEEKEWDYTLPNGGHPERVSKVSFAPDLVTEVRVFERWYQDEYEFSDKYWAKGPVRVTEDFSSVEDDDFEIEFLDATETAKELDLESSDDEDEEEDGVMKDFIFDDIDEAEDEGEDTDGGPLVRMA